MDWFGTIRDFTVSCSAVVASVVALRGLSSWKQQQRGKVEYDLARRMLANTYRLRDAVGFVRSPFMSAGEMDSPPPDSEHPRTPGEIKYYQEASAYQKRFKAVEEARANLFGDLLEAEVLWGKPLRDAYDELFRLVTTLFVSIQMYLEDVRVGNDDLTGDEHREQRSIIYETGDRGPDSFAEKLRLSIDKIEGLIRPALEKLR